jgi:hypothetical protein
MKATTSFPKRRRPQPLTRSSGSTYFSKLAYGGSSSPSAWYSAYHAADGTSRSRCAPHVHVHPLPTFPAPPTLFSFRLPETGTLPQPLPRVLSCAPSRPLGLRYLTHARRLLARARAWRPPISPERAPRVCQDSALTNRGAVRARRVPQAAHPRTDAATLGRARAWVRRKVVPRARVDADAVWRDRFPRVLSWSRVGAVPRALYHGM